MSCAITSGYTLDCKDVVGGLKAIYVSAKGIAGQISTNASGQYSVSGTTFYKIELIPQGANSFNQEPGVDNAKGTIFYTQNLTVELSRLKQATTDKVKPLTKARMWIIAETKNGELFLLGEEYGMEFNGGAGFGSGAAMADFNGYGMSFQGMEKNIATEVVSGGFTQG